MNMFTANNCSAEFSIENSSSIIPADIIFTGYSVTVVCVPGFHISTNVSSNTDTIEAQCTDAPEGNWTNIPSCDGGYYDAIQVSLECYEKSSSEK